MTEALVVLITAASEEEGDRIAGTLVNEHLAACVNRLPGVTSCFFWEGKVQRATECLLICKTTRRAFDELMARVQQLHSYSVPEIIAVPIVAGSPSYLDWISSSTGK